MKRSLIWLAPLLSLCMPVFAGDAEPLDLSSRYPHYYATIVINEDGTASEAREWSMTVLKEAAIDRAKRAYVTHSTSAQKAEITAAYTKKADGRRLDVSKDSYQIEANSGRDKAAPAFSDQTTVSVVFPDVAVGDTVFIAYRLTQTEPLFPRHFSIAETLSPLKAFDDVRVRIDFPASMWAQYQAYGMQAKEPTGQGGRKVLEWTYSNPQPRKSNRRDFSVYDPEKEPGFAFSTFRSYGEIAAAYGVRALPKATVTPRLEKLAREIVKDRSTIAEQARALYDWVATNLTYAGNCIGVGAVVPRDLDFVLDHKMGDCKDHATLLQALLEARGIQSTQALVNAGSIYRLRAIPVVATVNHVINRIPALDLYADATSKSTPFGMLPFGDADKPVLLVEGYKDGLKTPPSPVDANHQRMVAKLKLAGDGTIQGTIEVHEKGANAAETRAMARRMSKNAEEDFVKNMFRSMGMIGSGSFEKDDPTELSASYRYKATISLERFAKLPGAGAFNIYPLFPTAASIHNFVQSAIEPELEADVACHSGTSIEEYSIELPKNLRVLSLPENLRLSGDVLSYSARYKQKGNVLTVTRALEDRTKGNVCSAGQLIEYKKFAEKVMDDLKAQVLYK